LFTGPLYIVKPAMSRCVVTPNHHMLVSPARRSPATNYSYRYFPDKSDWQLVPFSALQKGRRSWYHVRRCAEIRTAEYPVEDEYLILAGLFIAEGSFGFRNGAVKDARVSQTEQGKSTYFDAADSLRAAFRISRYDYSKETVWRVPKEFAAR